MKAVVYSQYGGPEVLELRDLPEPKLSQNSVLIAVKAAGLNPADYILQEGLGDSLYDAWFPVVPGWDVAGVVEQVGPGVTEFSPGDEVIGFVREEILHSGGYVEKISADVSMLVAKPQKATWAQAAGLPLAGLTAYQAVCRTLNVNKGDVLLVHGASGGVGSLAVQMAVLGGARVIGTASETNHGYLRSIGAEPVTYGQGLVDRVKALAPNGVDAFLDAAGQDALELLQGVSNLETRACSIAGIYPAMKPVFVRLDTKHLGVVAEWVESGQLAVRVAATYPLARAAEAQTALRSGHSPGKVILEIS